MQVDSGFFDPIKEFHPVLRVVEMKHEELASMLPLRINHFSFVRHPYKEEYGFPISSPKISGEELLRVHTSLLRSINKNGATLATVKSENPLISNTTTGGNYFVALGGTSEYHLRSNVGEGNPVVVFDDRMIELDVVEAHINTLAIYCNALHHDPKDGKSPLLNRIAPNYEIDSMGFLIGRGSPKKRYLNIHGRWDFQSARDELFTCIINYMRI